MGNNFGCQSQGKTKLASRLLGLSFWKPAITKAVVNCLMLSEEIAKEKFLQGYQSPGNLAVPACLDFVDSLGQPAAMGMGRRIA